MKYIKEYIDWGNDEFDIEEDDPNGVGPFKVGDMVTPENGYIMYYDTYESKFNTYDYNSNLKISIIEHSSNIKDDGEGNSIHIDYDGYLFKAKGLWPWIKFDELVKIK